MDNWEKQICLKAGCHLSPQLLNEQLSLLTHLNCLLQSLLFTDLFHFAADFCQDEIANADGVGQEDEGHVPVKEQLFSQVPDLLQCFPIRMPISRLLAVVSFKADWSAVRKVFASRKIEL